MYISTSSTWLVPTEVRIKHWIPWSWSCGWLWANVWVLRTEPRSSARSKSCQLLHHLSREARKKWISSSSGIRTSRSRELSIQILGKDSSWLAKGHLLYVSSYVSFHLIMGTHPDNTTWSLPSLKSPVSKYHHTHKNSWVPTSSP